MFRLNLCLIVDIYLSRETEENALTSGNPKEKNLIYIVELMLECFRQYKKMEFKPNKKALWSLVDMGFEEKKVVVALKITGNDQANAVSNIPLCPEKRKVYFTISN